MKAGFRDRKMCKQDNLRQIREPLSRHITSLHNILLSPQRRVDFKLTSSVRSKSQNCNASTAHLFDLRFEIDLKKVKSYKTSPAIALCLKLRGGRLELKGINLWF